MDKNSIIKYINEGKEIELLEQFELLGFNEYNEKYKKLLAILVVLLNFSESNFLSVQQFLFKTIYKVFEPILHDRASIEQFIEIIKINSDSNYGNISHFIGRFILNIKDNVEQSKEFQNISLLEDALKKLNLCFLNELIADQKEFSAIINVLYNCIHTLEKDRKIILQFEAVDCFYKYLKRNPKDYLAHFIRPYYSGPTKFWAEYYLHVPEPFCEQIFRREKLESFLDNIKSEDLESKLVSDIRSFYREATSRPNNEDKVVMLFSLDNEQSEFRSHHLKLLSPEHVYVRESCRPPDYKSDKP